MKKHQLFKKIQTPNNINHIIEYSSVKANNYSEQNFFYIKIFLKNPKFLRHRKKDKPRMFKSTKTQRQQKEKQKHSIINKI